MTNLPKRDEHFENFVERCKTELVNLDDVSVGELKQQLLVSRFALQILELLDANVDHLAELAYPHLNAQDRKSLDTIESEQERKETLASSIACSASGIAAYLFMARYAAKKGSDMDMEHSFQEGLHLMRIANSTREYLEGTVKEFSKKFARMYIRYVNGLDPLDIDQLEREIDKRTA